MYNSIRPPAKVQELLCERKQAPPTGASAAAPQKIKKKRTQVGGVKAALCAQVNRSSFFIIKLD